MTLQRRLALSLLISAAPLVAGLAWLRVTGARNAEDAALRDLVLTRAATVGREACEASPASFGIPLGPGGGPPFMRARRPEGAPPAGAGAGVIHPPHLSPGTSLPRQPRLLRSYVYDDAFTPTSPDAPEFPPSLRDTLRGGRDRASRRVMLTGERATVERVEIGVSTGWTPGPCAHVLVWRDGPPTIAPVHEWLVSIVPLLAGLIGAMWLTAVPVVRRVRALAAAVRQSAATRYETPVPEAGRDEITDLARAFNEAGTEVRAHVATVERRDRTLREFLTNTTHDVMIPLTVLQGHLSAMEREAASTGRLDREVIVGAMSEAHHIGSLLHNLAAVAKLEAPEDLVQRHPVDLAALVERIVERHRPLARPAGVAIDYAVPEHPVVVPGDVTLLEQAVGNVVHNAVRYNRPGGHVAVVLDQPSPACACRLRVADDGPGVAEAELQRITERRYRDEGARRRDPAGLGLGLSIACEVADRHGVRLRIQRVEPTGLEVVFEWPDGSVAGSGAAVD